MQSVVHTKQENSSDVFGVCFLGLLSAIRFSLL